MAQGELVSQPAPGIATLYDIFQKGATTNPEGNCLGYRDASGVYRWQSYSEVAARVASVGTALKLRGATRGSVVAIYCSNGVEFAICVQACNRHSLIAVPLYDTLGQSVCQFILNQTKASILVVGRKQVKGATVFLQHCAHVNLVVSLSSQSEDLQKLAEASPDKSKKDWVISFATLEAEGRHGEPVAADCPAPDDVATICYTSGTTGDPKGVLVTHGALTADVAGVRARLDAFRVDKKDVHISYLPMAHMFERLVQEMVFLVGGSVGFYSGDTTKLFDDILALRPTIFVSVPRIYTRLYELVNGSVHSKGWVQRTLFYVALQEKKRNLRSHIVTHWLWDRLLFDNIARRLGGRVRLMVSGAAPLRGEVMAFLRCCFSCNVIEGYGQTENAAAATATMPGDCSLNHVGPPLPCVEMKLIDVPEMMYFSSDTPRPRGEICVRGPVVFQRYHTPPNDDGPHAVDKDGWLHTGDIGMWNPNGTLSIMDRRKNIFKLAQGEYVAPERVESVYLGSPFISQIFVHGESVESALVAIVVPNEEFSLEYARSNSIPGKTLQELCETTAFEKAVLFDMKTQANAKGLKGFESVQIIHLTSTPFSIENGLLTATFKLKRPLACKMFQREIAAMYKELRGVKRRY